MKLNQIPIVSIIGYSNSGKTTLVEKLIKEFKNKNLKVGTVKHDVHGFEMDHPGKDSFRHKKAGASISIISSPYQIGMVRDVDHDYKPTELLPFFHDMDIVLVEGYKKDKTIHKIEIFRKNVSESRICINDPNLIAIVSDTTFDTEKIPQFSLNDINGLIEYLIFKFKIKG